MKMDIPEMLQTFNLPRQATPRQVKSAYRQLARKWHPDRCIVTGEPPESAQNRMQAINQAREALLAYVRPDLKTGSAGLPDPPRNRSPVRSLSRDYADNGRQTVSQQASFKGFKRSGDNPNRIRSRELVRAAGAWLRQGRFSRSLMACNQALRFDRGNATAYNRRGVVFRATGRYSEAVKDFTRAIRLAPDDAAALINRGEAYGDRGQYTQAMADFNNAVRIDPDDARAYRSRARLLFKTRHYDRALEDMRRALAL